MRIEDYLIFREDVINDKNPMRMMEDVISNSQYPYFHGRYVDTETLKMRYFESGKLQYPGIAVEIYPMFALSEGTVSKNVFYYFKRMFDAKNGIFTRCRQPKERVQRFIGHFFSAKWLFFHGSKARSCYRRYIYDSFIHKVFTVKDEVFAGGRTRFGSGEYLIVEPIVEQYLATYHVAISDKDDINQKIIKYQRCIPKHYGVIDINISCVEYIELIQKDREYLKYEKDKEFIYATRARLPTKYYETSDVSTI